jgi:hypothetical protein
LNAAEPVLAADTPCRALPRLAQWPTVGWGEQAVSMVDLACAPQGPGRPAAIAPIDPDRAQPTETHR